MEGAFFTDRCSFVGYIDTANQIQIDGQSIIYRYSVNAEMRNINAGMKSRFVFSPLQSPASLSLVISLLICLLSTFSPAWRPNLTWNFNCTTPRVMVALPWFLSSLKLRVMTTSCCLSWTLPVSSFIRLSDAMKPFYLVPPRAKTSPSMACKISWTPSKRKAKILIFTTSEHLYSQSFNSITGVLLLNLLVPKMFTGTCSVKFSKWA